MLPGVYIAKKKNGSIYYRASITYRGKHISLGSYMNETDASSAYRLGTDILSTSAVYSIAAYPQNSVLPFDKWITNQF